MTLEERLDRIHRINEQRWRRILQRYLVLKARTIDRAIMKTYKMHGGRDEKIN